MMNLICSLLSKRLPHCVLFRNLEKFPDDTVIWEVGAITYYVYLLERMTLP